MTINISPTEWEALSAFLDEQLSPKERARLEGKLKERADLRAALEELRRTRTVLRNTPRLRAPRNFTLTAEMVGLKAPRRADPFSWFPALRLTSALASLMLGIALLGEFFLGGGPATAPMLAAQPAGVSVAQESDAQIESSAEAAPEENLRNVAPEAPVAEQPAPTAEELAMAAQMAEPYPAPTEDAAMSALSTGETQAPALKAVETPTPEAVIALAPAPADAYPEVEPMIASAPESVGQAYPESLADTGPAPVPAEQAVVNELPATFWNPWRVAELALALIAVFAGLVAFFIWRSDRA